MYHMKMIMFFRCTAWGLVAAIAVLTLSPIEARPVTGSSADLERFAAFAVLGSTFGLGHPRHRLGIIMLVVAIAGVLELAQHFVPGRHGRLEDGAVKAMAAALGGVVAIAVKQRL